MEEEIEHVRKLLPKIANGRKTRHKKQSALSNEQSAKTKRRRRQECLRHTRRNKPNGQHPVFSDPYRPFLPYQ